MNYVHSQIHSPARMILGAYRDGVVRISPSASSRQRFAIESSIRGANRLLAGASCREVALRVVVNARHGLRTGALAITRQGAMDGINAAIASVAIPSKCVPAIAFDAPHKARRSWASGALASLIAAAVVCGGLLAPARPAMASTWHIDANVASYHTRAWARRALNQSNPGVGVTWQASRTWGISGGVYRNSYRRPTVYALVSWTPLQIGSADGWHVDAGVATGLLSGYKHDEVPTEPLGGGAVVRLVAPSGVALNLIGVPNTTSGSGFVGFQISIPVTRQKKG